MALLSGGSSWRYLQKDPVGTVTKGTFVSFSTDVPSNYGPQDVLKLDLGDGEVVSIGCKAALARVFRANPIKPGAVITITYQGQKISAAGKPFHAFAVDASDPVEDDSFDVAADEEAELEKRLAEARAKRRVA